MFASLGCRIRRVVQVKLSCVRQTAVISGRQFALVNTSISLGATAPPHLHPLVAGGCCCQGAACKGSDGYRGGCGGCVPDQAALAARHHPSGAGSVAGAVHLLHAALHGSSSGPPGDCCG
eukprot:1127903-Pelagomonas_calceolata.AAC.3